VRRLRYQVTTSLDGFIAGPNGEFDWIVMGPDIDFAARFAQFDTAVMGGNTSLASLQQGGSGTMPGLDLVAFSRTLRPADYPKSGIWLLEYTIKR
jgi:dihydrofolate reductase